MRRYIPGGMSAICGTTAAAGQSDLAIPRIFWFGGLFMLFLQYSEIAVSFGFLHLEHLRLI